MADITVKLIPNKSAMPVSDTGDPEFGSLNYIFYPGISACQEIELTNNTGAAITPIISFGAHNIDAEWWRTLRVSTLPCSGVMPAGDPEEKWSGVINASGSVSLYVYSDVTKEGWSRQYDGTYWTNSGFVIGNEDLINDRNEETAAIDCDAANAGSTLRLDLGATVTEAYHRIKFSVDGVVNMECNIQYSDNGTTWTTVYTGADLSITGTKKQITFWWNDCGAHRYWRIIKTNAASAGANITEVQWLLFEAHKDAYDFGVYGDRKAYMIDSTNHMDDFEWRSSVMIATDSFSRQNYFKPIGRVGGHTTRETKNIETYGQTVQLWYVPTMTFTYNLNSKSDYQLEARVWDTKAIIVPQKRTLQYTAAADGLQPSLYRYDQRTIVLPPFGPDWVGWYMVNYDFWHAYGHSYYVIWDSKVYKIDDPQPIYFDNEIVAMSARMMLCPDMSSIATDPRNYVLGNRDGLFAQHPNPMPIRHATFANITAPDQRSGRWIGAVPSVVFSRNVGLSRPNTYELADVLASDAWPVGDVMETEDWIDPAHSNFTTSSGVGITGPAFAKLAKTSGTDGMFQMDRFYNWIGYYDASGSYDPVNAIIQVYMDEDCTVPVKINLQSDGAVAKVENHFDEAYIDAGTYAVTLTALGESIMVDGHWIKTPSKLYVRWRVENDESTYYV